jgi:uncharacterized delta-60 repeat protein
MIRQFTRRNRRPLALQNRRSLRLESLEERRVLTVALDPTFGDSGVVTTNLGYVPGANYAQDVAAIQADGKTVVVGYSNSDFALVRYNADGSLDNSFGSGGKVTTDFGGSSDQAFGVAVDADGKIVVAGYSYQGNAQQYDFAVARYNTDGSLDATFGTDGKATVDFDGDYDWGQDVAIQADGKIVLAGYVRDSSGYYDFGLSRLNTDGTLDTSFGGDGTVTTDFAGNNDSAYAVAIDGDGKIVVAGDSRTGYYYDFAAARYNPDGSLDTSFDVDGKVTTDFDGSADRAFDVAIASDGNVVLAGSSYQGPTYTDFALVRYLSDGSLDPSFDGDGRVTTDFTNNTDQAYSVAIASDDSIVVAGIAYQAPYEIAVARYQTNGALDTSFSGDGKVIVNAVASSINEQAYGVTFDQDGKIVVAGYAAEAGQTYDFVVVRLDTGGTLDATFDGDGIVITDIEHETYEYAQDMVAMQTDGKILVVANGTSAEFSIVRYNVDGTLDSSFGSGGILSSDFGGTYNLGYAMVVDSNDKIMVAGAVWDPVNGYDFAVARYNSDGSRDNSFDGDGLVRTDLGSSSDRVTRMILDADGKIVVVGGSVGVSGYDFAVARYNPDGSLDTTFDGDGKLTTDIGGSTDFAETVAIDGNGRILVAGESYRGLSRYDMAVVRYNADGSLDTGFGTGGIVTTDIAGDYDYGYSMAIDSMDRILLVGSSYEGSSSNGDIALVRYLSDGSLDTSFDADGIVTTDLAGEYDGVYDVVLDDQNRILVAGETSSNGASNWDFVLGRYNPDGSLDSSFDGDGLLTTDLGTLYDGVWRMAIDSAGRIVVAGWGATDIAVARYTSNHAPQVADQTFEVSENLAVGQSVGTVVIDDPDANDTHDFAITGGNELGAFAINSATGEITVADSALLDFETNPTFSLTVHVQDAAGAEDEGTVTINLLNQASVTGVVFLDVNANGIFEANEPGIDGVTIELLDAAGNPVLDEANNPVTATTSDGGFYLFEDLDPGTYRLHELQPNGVDDGDDFVGSLGGTIVSNDTFELSLQRTDATDYVFSELGRQISSGDTATIGFWQNKHGQQLIEAGGTALADWLTNNFPNVFGDSFVGADGSDVANFFRTELFRQKGQKTAGPAKVDAQFMGVALATFFTSRNLAGEVAAAFGFNVTDTGIGMKAVNVGSHGDAFAVADNTEMTIMQLLSATDSLTDVPDGISGFAYIYDTNGDGVIDGAESALRSSANEIFSGINEQGDT